MPETFKLVDRDVPDGKDKEVLVKVRSVLLLFSDIRSPPVPS
jgi:NADPH:quinone reductase-like Zn-dependent oxidoreductase